MPSELASTETLRYCWQKVSEPRTYGLSTTTRLQIVLQKVQHHVHAVKVLRRLAEFVGTSSNLPCGNGKRKRANQRGAATCARTHTSSSYSSHACTASGHCCCCRRLIISSSASARSCASVTAMV